MDFDGRRKIEEILNFSNLLPFVLDKVRPEISGKNESL